MKRIFLTYLFFQLAVVISQAQRNVDMAIDQIIEPTVIKHNQVIKTKFIVRNLGPDIVKPGDTLFYMAFLKKNQRVTPSNFSVFSKNLNINDTASFGFDISPEQVSGPSFRSDFCLLVTIRNRRMTDSVKTESTSGSANNLKCLSLEYLDSNGWGVGIQNQLIEKTISFYPNPAVDRACLTFDNFETSNTIVCIFDYFGRQVLRQASHQLKSGNQRIEFDLNHLGSGLYFYELSVGTFRQRSRFIISK